MPFVAVVLYLLSWGKYLLSAMPYLIFKAFSPVWFQNNRVIRHERHGVDQKDNLVNVLFINESVLEV